MTGLRISETLTLPEDAVTETFAILAKRGKGKTNTAVVMAEEMIAAGLPVVVIDPVGVWWGLRSSADGQSAGLPVVIFGGDHADVPLEETAGTLVADVLVEQRFPAVIDLSALSKSAARRFMAPFLERLYHRNRDALHVIIDEADAFAPQRAAAEGARLLGAMEDLVRRGRARGIGCTLITQRPAVIHKDVLTQAEVLIALGMTGPRDVAAIDEWVKLHADEDQAREVKASLPGLPVGTAWVWSPGWLDILRKVQIRARHTFDSSATPRAGEKRAAPKRMADVDLAALGEQITATAERAKADDPKQLRRRIADLERQLAAIDRDRLQQVTELQDLLAAARTETQEVPVPMLATEHLDAFSSVAGRLLEVLSDVERRLQQYPSELPTEGKQGQPTTRRSAPPRTASTDPGRAPGAGPSTHREKNPPAARETRPAAAGGTPADVQVKAGARRILETLARYQPMRLTKAQLGTLAKFKITGGTFQTYWSTLRRAGFIDDNGTDLTITRAGVDYLGLEQPPEPLTTDELIAQWRDVLKAGARTMLDVLVEAYPTAMTKDDLAAQVQMTASGGTFQTYLSTLRRNGLVDVDGSTVTASETLFLA